LEIDVEVASGAIAEIELDPDWMEARRSPSGVDICFVTAPPDVVL
jgi:hypothetical protein